MFKIADDFLGKYRDGPLFLEKDEIANIIWTSLLFFHNRRYDLSCFCIMPNHVHILFIIINKDSNEPFSLPFIMQSHKGFTAREANKVLNQKGKFWQNEYYDHYIRNDQEFYSKIWYILNNPVNAGLVSNWKDWKFTWVAKNILGSVEFHNDFNN